MESTAPAKAPSPAPRRTPLSEARPANAPVNAPVRPPATPGRQNSEIRVNRIPEAAEHANQTHRSNTIKVPRQRYVGRSRAGARLLTDGEDAGEGPREDAGEQPGEARPRRYAPALLFRRRRWQRRHFHDSSSLTVRGRGGPPPRLRKLRAEADRASR